MSERTLNLIKDNDIRWVDLRFTDTRGKEQHVSIPASQVDEDFSKMEKCSMAHQLLVGRA